MSNHVQHNHLAERRAASLTARKLYGSGGRSSSGNWMKLPMLMRLLLQLLFLHAIKPGTRARHNLPLCVSQNCKLTMQITLPTLILAHALLHTRIPVASFGGLRGFPGI
ncbi:uncharacterized protein LOC27207098 [Drosophila simulans]|uniref:Uncharacterized protein n=2 Tax=melanogaster subgroup TaxID=32351 RepID=A0A0J9RE88_DROSI|nr:uncharacterized protein LOC27207098 [Drosophila simulans]XP_033155174.1 uncharacterized protein LOC117137711 [Drosophila mauritiana]KMY93899.1 uncharacterized protein Dsimw501_GD27248 [Drosophila simulans]